MKTRTELEASDIDMADETSVAIALGITLASMHAGTVAKETDLVDDARARSIAATMVAEFLNVLSAVDLVIVKKETVPTAYRQ